MGIVEIVIHHLDFNYRYASVLVSDVPESMMTSVPCRGLENHPAFTLGHLISAASMVVLDLGGVTSMPDDWRELFERNGPGDPRLPELDSEKYPSKDDLLRTLEQEHESIKKLLLAASNADLAEDVNWRFDKYFPNKIDAIYFMCATHAAMHLGQLAAWRRAMKLPSVLNSIK